MNAFTFVTTQTALASAIGKELGIEVTRKTIGDYLRKFANPKDGLPAAPETKADGRYYVQAWVEFFKARNVKRAASNSATDSGDDDAIQDGLSTAEYKAIQEKHKARILKQKADQQEGKLLSRDKVEKALGTTLTSIRKALEGIPSRVANKISGKMGYDEKSGIVQDEIDAALRIMENAHRIAEPV